MSRFFKKFLLFIAFAFLGIGLVGCGEDVTITTTPSAQTNKVVAKMDASLQGTYYGDDVVVVVGESKVSITDPSGKTLEFTIYKEGDKYYIEEEGQKVYCTFGDGTVTNVHGTFVKNGGSQSGTDTPAQLDATLQGTYYGDDVVVVVGESKVSITDPSGKTLEFTIYKEGDKYYIKEEGQKVYCTFGNGTVTNVHGTFVKNGGSQSGTDTPAQIDARLQGDYFAGSLKITVGASKVTVIDASGKRMEYNLYQENGRIYFYDEGQKIYCTFENNTIKNIYGTFTRNSSGGMTSISAEEAALKFAGFLEFNGKFRVPGGSTISDMTYTEDGIETYSITILSPDEDFNTYKTFFDEFFNSLGYTQSQSSWIKMNGQTQGKGASVVYDAQTNILGIVGTKFNLGGGESDTLAPENFAKLFKEKSGIELKFPTEVESITDVVNRDEDGYIHLSGTFTYGDPSSAEDTFNQIVRMFSQSIEAKEYTRGEVNKQQYANLVSYSLQWTNKNYSFVILEMLSYSDMNEFSISFSGEAYNGGGGQTTDSWPTNEISSFFSNIVTIPAYEGTFNSISSNTLNQDGSTALQVLINGTVESEFKVWVQSLTRSGFIANEETWLIKYLENGYVAEVYAYASPDGFASITFKYTLREVSPWPSALIEEKFGRAVLDALIIPDNSPNTSYAASYALGTLNISVDSGLQTDLYEKYVDLLGRSGFTNLGNDRFQYVFENHDMIELTLYRPSYALNRFSMTIEFEEYVGMEYIIPTNFHANISGFTLTKIGESYVYLYSYQAGIKLIDVYLFDGTTNKWMYASGSIYTGGSESENRVVWQNLSSSSNPVYYQYVDRPQVEEFLEGTNGLAYYYYKEYKDATNATKDSSKNQTIAGVSCEYVTFSNSMSAGGYTVSYKTELWIDPVSHMIYKVIASSTVNGSSSSNTVFEIKSMDLSVRSFAEVGITNCILPRLDGSSLTDSDHAYGEIQTVNATCGKDGVKYQICSACGEKKVIETIKATGVHSPEMDGSNIVYAYDYNGHHSKYCTECHQYYDQEDCTYDEWLIERAPTCTHPGSMSSVCKICGSRATKQAPVDPDAHVFSTDRVVIVMPTKEKAGSITWNCSEGCGATRSLALKVLSETNYIMGVYHDYDSGKNYELFALDMTAFVKEINDLLNPLTPIDEYYVTGGLFNYDQLIYNYDDQNPLYGFIGDEASDSLAVIHDDYRGEFYNEDNHKLVVGESTFSLTIGDDILNFTLYSNSEDEIYFEDNSTKKYIFLYDDGIELQDYGVFYRREIAVLDSSLWGEYVNDEDLLILVEESYVTVDPSGENLAYEIYIQNDVFYIIDDNRLIECNIGGDIVENEFGVFYRVEEDYYSFPYDKVYELLQVDDFYVLTWTDAEYHIMDSEEGTLVINMVLPDGTDVNEAYLELIGYIENYDVDNNYYYDEINDYTISLVPSDEGIITVTYIKN